jgi:hypothetical protein
MPAIRSDRNRPDVILWDLVDERLGVMELPDGAGYLTVSNELLASGMRLPDGTVHVPFGDDRHFELWTESLDRFHHMLRAHGLLRRTVLLTAPWAVRTAGGAPTPPSHGVSAEEGNRLFERYVRAAAAWPGLAVVALTAQEAVGAEEHKWGPAPFHYTDDFYRTVAARVDALVTARQEAERTPAGP